MSVGSAIFWLFVAAWVVLVAYLAAAIVPRIVRETMRIIRRIPRLTERPDLVAAADDAQRNLARLEASVRTARALAERAAVTVDRVRAVRFVSPEVRAFVARARLEFDAFRAER